MDSRFVLKVVWLEKDIGIAVDQVVGKGTSPLTEYFFWPRNNAWEQLQEELEKKSWISQLEQVEILNKATEIINFWQENARTTSMVDAQTKFPELMFSGSN